MGISEVKKKIVIENYFKVECDINTSIKEAFTKGFELGLKKAPQSKTGHWIEHEIKDACRWLTCSVCGYEWVNKKENFCPDCGAKMIDPDERKAQDEDKIWI